MTKTHGLLILRCIAYCNLQQIQTKDVACYTL